MMELVIYLKNESDLAVLEPLLRRLKLRFEKKNGQQPAATSQPLLPSKLEAARARLLQMHEDGTVDASYFGEPVEWQRSIREDKPLPFRDVEN
ncbi:MAG: hypothetical protein ACK4Q5_19120 [Saprospiraceae bacterium]